MINFSQSSYAKLIIVLTFFCFFVGLSEVWAGNSGSAISELFTELDEDISDEPVFFPHAEAVAAKAYDDLRDKIVKKTGLDYQ